MTTVLENKYIEPELRHIETTRFELRKEVESYHKEQMEIEEEESDKFTALVESIKDLGILQPVYVIERKRGEYEVVDGGRRIRAARFLGLQKIPAMVFQGEQNETELRKRSLIANVHRKDLTEEEKGEGLALYYSSGGVNPIHAVDFLNMLRSRQRREFARSPGKLKHGGGRPNRYEKVENTEEYEKFRDLHKKLGVPRMTQYSWMSKVVWIAEEIRKSKEYQALPKKDQEVLTKSEVRNNTEVQKEIVEQLYTINNDMNKVKEKEKKDVVEAMTEESKEEKEKVLKQYFPETENKKKKKEKSPDEIYADINGKIQGLWSGLTGLKGKGHQMPKTVDDLFNDFIKPTREFFNEYISGISEEERRQQYNWLSFLEELMSDRLKLLDKATK